MAVLVLCGNGVCMGDRWIEAWSATEGDGLRVWAGVESDDLTTLDLNGTMKLDIYEEDTTNLVYTYSEDTNESSFYSSYGSSTTWKSPRISYDEMKLTDKFKAMSLPTLDIQVSFTTNGNETLKDKSSLILVDI